MNAILEAFKAGGEVAVWQLVCAVLGLLCLILFSALVRSRRKTREILAHPPPSPEEETEPQAIVGRSEFFDDREKEIETLRQLEAKVEFFFEESQTFNLVIGMDGKLLDVNRAFLNIFDMEKAGLIGRNPAELVVAEQREEFSKYLAKHLEDKFASHLEVDFEGSAEPRKILLGERHVNIVKNFVPTGILLSGVDVTHLRRSEEKEGALKKQLALTARMETLGILAGGVAHDLKNLFSPILSYPEFIKKQLPPDSPLRASLDKIEQSAVRSLEVIQNFLTLARRGKYELEPMDINNVIETYLESADFNEIKRCSDIKVQLDLAKELPLVEGLSSQMMNVIMNLTRNACEAMSSGGALRITTSRKKLEFPHKGFQQIPIGDYVVVEIDDEGTGIKKEDLSSIFVPFASKKKMGRSGSGLGTVIISGVIADHRGYIDIDTEVGKGTKFYIYLRALQDTSIRKKEEDLTGSEKVLVVDNSKEDRELAERFLLDLGYRVDSVESGAETLDYLKKNEADIVVLDIVLDDSNGIDIFSEVLKFKPKQKVVVVSSYWNPDDRKKASRLGITQCLEKPINCDTIGQAVREELDKK